MPFEAIQLQSWYATPQGQMVQRLLSDVMKRWMGKRKLAATLGFGYTQPYLDRADPWGGKLLGASPAEMGVVTWPRYLSNRVALVRPDALPFPDESFDLVIMAHLLEGAQSPGGALREAWRILEPGGRLFAVVPNRGGIWARRDATPFGWGRPFSPRQLHTQLQQSFFIPRQSSYALYTPPISGRFWLRIADAMEKAGERWLPFMGGVILCEAEKVVVASTPIDGVTMLSGGRRLTMPLAERHRGVHGRWKHLEERS
ncbi:MAG: class I SAM-dependent methyltransferase [Magnetococcales bacterium]|nr:class I SAM-dependent methyltransferase [Magnetococcales bacterium]